MRQKRHSNTPDTDQLRRFTPLQKLSDGQLSDIANKAHWQQAGKRTLLMDIGDTEESSIFLLKGNVLLEAADGRQRIIKHTDPAATSPLSRLRPSRYRVTALTPVRYIKIDNCLLDELLAEEEASEMISSHYLVEEGGDTSADFSTQMLAQIYEDLHKDALLILSWQPAALAISKGIIAEQSDLGRISELVMLDPVLAIKLLKTSSTDSRDGMAEEITTAVHQIGLQQIQRLAFMSLFRESCDTRTPLLGDAFRNAWEQSIIVSALSRTLAIRHGLEPANTIALAGLLHNIGEITIISSAYTFYREITDKELKECVRMFGKETGRLIFGQWGMPDHLLRGISDSFDWSTNHGGAEPTLSDILIAARIYTRLVRKNRDLPKVPALRKLGLDDPHSERSQQLQAQVHAAVQEVRAFLGMAPAAPGEEQP